jgi:hypothetical protein
MLAWAMVAIVEVWRHTAFMRNRQLSVRGFTIFALVLTVAGCSSGALLPASSRRLPSPASRVPVGLQADATIAPCLPGDVSVTTTATLIAPPNAAAVQITVTLLNRMDFACALPKLGCPHGDDYAEVVNAVGAVVWTPGYAIGCPPQYRQAPNAVASHSSLRVTEVWDLFDCGPAYGCAATHAAAGMYRARGMSESLGVSSESASFAVS